MRFAADLDAYARRIGYSGPLRMNLVTLQTLVGAHVTTIPVENIDPLMAVPVELDPVAVEDKLVHARRGGSGFENNVLLAGALSTLGFSVTPLLARVLWQRPDDADSAPGHLVLKVDLDGKSWLIDGGFHEVTPPGPLCLCANIEQMTSHEPFRLLQIGRHWQLQAKLAEQWRALYRFELQPCEAIDYRVASYYESSHPDSPSTRHLHVSRLGPGHRMVLRDGHFSVFARDGGSEHCTLTQASQIRELLVNRFGLWLPRQGALDQRLDYLLGGPSLTVGRSIASLDRGTMPSLAVGPRQARAAQSAGRHLRLV